MNDQRLVYIVKNKDGEEVLISYSQDQAYTRYAPDKGDTITEVEEFDYLNHSS